MTKSAQNLSERTLVEQSVPYMERARAAGAYISHMYGEREVRVQGSPYIGY